MKKFSHFSFLIGLALFVLLLSRLNLWESWRVLKTINLRWFLPALLFCVPEVLLKSLRLKTFVRKAGKRVSLSQALQAFLSGQPLASVTPGKLGDVSRVVLLNRYSGLSMPHCLSVHVADRIYDLAAVALLAVIGLVWRMTDAQNQGSLMAVLLGILAGMVLIILFLHPLWVKTILKPMVLALAPASLGDRLNQHGKEFYSLLQTLLIPSYRIFGPLVLSLLAWETAILRAFFCVLALGLPLTALKFILLAPAMVMVELLPISIMGFGTREAAMFILFSSSELPQESLLALSLLIVLAGPLFTALVGIPTASGLFSKRAPTHG